MTCGARELISSSCANNAAQRGSAVRPSNAILCPIGDADAPPDQGASEGQGGASADHQGGDDTRGDIIEEPEEERTVKMIRSPVTPTADEWNSHMVTHVPFRDWCPHCVRGRGNNDHHRRAQGREADDGRIVVSMDYGFLGSTGQGSSSTATMLVLKVKSTGMLTAMIVPKKGAENSWVQKRCARWIDNQGHGRINLRTDGEPAIVDLAKNVRRQREEGTETVLEHPPVGES